MQQHLSGDAQRAANAHRLLRKYSWAKLEARGIQLLTVMLSASSDLKAHHSASRRCTTENYCRMTDGASVVIIKPKISSTV